MRCVALSGELAEVCRVVCVISWCLGVSVVLAEVCWFVW